MDRFKNKLSTDALLGLILSVIVTSHFLNFFSNGIINANLISFFVFLFMLIALPTLRGGIMMITYLLLIASFLLFFYTNSPITAWIEGLRVNLTLVTIISFVPLLGIPIRGGNYVEALQVFLKRINKSIPVLYVTTQTVTHLLGVVLNIGSISIMHYLSSALVVPQDRVLINAINRGFIAALFWSPYFSSMALILSHLPVKWSGIAFPLIGFVLITFIVSTLVEWPYMKKKEEMDNNFNNQENLTMDHVKAKKKAIECFAILFVMIAIVLLVELFLPFNMTIIICVISILFPLLWSVVYKKWNVYRNEVKNHVTFSLPRMKKEIALFFAAGFFSQAFIETNVSDAVVNWVQPYIGNWMIGISIIITLIISITAIVGLHPIVMVTIFVTSFDPHSLGMSAEYFAVLLLISWGISNTLSPASAVNNLMANFWNLKITDVSFKWNLKFVLIMIALLPIYLFLIKI